MAVFFRKSRLDLKEFKVHNPGGFEVLQEVGRVAGIGIKLVVIACYLSPNYAVPCGKAALEHIVNCIIQAKRKYDNPMIVVSGDFNQWKISETNEDLWTSMKLKAGQQETADVLIVPFP